MKKPSIIPFLLVMAALIIIMAGCNNGTDYETPVGNQTITGFVIVASGDVTPISGATVTLSAEGFQPVTSDDDGSFTFTKVPVGSYNIQCKRDGYINSRVYFNVTDQDQTVRAVTTVYAGMVTIAGANGAFGPDHQYDAQNGYFIVSFTADDGSNLAGASLGVSPDASAVGFFSAGAVDWSATSSAADGPGVAVVTPGNEYNLTPYMDDTTFSPTDKRITPIAGETTFTSFRAQ